MATPKYRGLKLGPGNLNDRNLESEIYVEPSQPRNGTAGSVQWDVGTTYNLNDAILYEGQSYNSLIAGNTGNQPDTSPSEWKPVDGKDGDIWVQVPSAGYPAGGADSEIWLKVNTFWRPLSWSNPLTVALNDNQATPETAFEYPAGVLRYAVVEYTVKRGLGESRKRSGKFVILNDGGVIDFSNEYSEIGFEVQVYFDFDIFAGAARCRYTSADEAGTPIEMRYIIRGW